MSRSRTRKADAAAPQTGPGATGETDQATAPAATEGASSAAADAKPATDQAAPKAAPAKSVRVICMARGGRRRGGRGWPEGETMVPADEMTAELRKALASDPMFLVGD